MSNSLDPDETPRYAASHLDPNCLQSSPEQEVLMMGDSRRYIHPPASDGSVPPSMMPTTAPPGPGNPQVSGVQQTNSATNSPVQAEQKPEKVHSGTEEQEGLPSTSSRTRDNDCLQPSDTHAKKNARVSHTRSYNNRKNFGPGKQVFEVTNLVDLENFPTIFQNDELRKMSEQCRSNIWKVFYNPERIKEVHLKTVLVNYLKDQNPKVFFEIKTGEGKNVSDIRMLSSAVKFHYTEPIEAKLNFVSGDFGFTTIYPNFFGRHVGIVNLHNQYKQEANAFQLVYGPDNKIEIETEFQQCMEVLITFKDMKKIVFELSDQTTPDLSLIDTDPKVVTLIFCLEEQKEKSQMPVSNQSMPVNIFIFKTLQEHKEDGPSFFLVFASFSLHSVKDIQIPFEIRSSSRPNIPFQEIEIGCLGRKVIWNCAEGPTDRQLLTKQQNGLSHNASLKDSAEWPDLPLPHDISSSGARSKQGLSMGQTYAEKTNVSPGRKVMNNHVGGLADLQLLTKQQTGWSHNATPKDSSQRPDLRRHHDISPSGLRSNRGLPMYQTYAEETKVSAGGNVIWNCAGEPVDLQLLTKQQIGQLVQSHDASLKDSAEWPDLPRPHDISSSGARSKHDLPMGQTYAEKTKVSPGRKVMINHVGGLADLQLLTKQQTGWSHNATPKDAAEMPDLQRHHDMYFGDARSKHDLPMGQTYAEKTKVSHKQINLQGVCGHVKQSKVKNNRLFGVSDFPSSLSHQQCDRIDGKSDTSTDQGNLPHDRKQKCLPSIDSMDAGNVQNDGKPGTVPEPLTLPSRARQKRLSSLKSDQNSMKPLSRQDQDRLRNLDLEARSRQNNLIFGGFPENRREDCRQIIKHFLFDRLNIRDSIAIERAHRLGKSRPGNQRRIIVQFCDFTATELILSNAKHLKNTDYNINRDYPQEIVDARKVLWPEYKSVRQKNPKSSVKIVYPAKLMLDKKVIRDMFPQWDSVMSRAPDKVGISKTKTFMSPPNPTM